MGAFILTKMERSGNVINIEEKGKTGYEIR